MKLISTFYDYYDSAKCFSFCEGSEAIYIRKSKEHTIELPSMHSTYYVSSNWFYNRSYRLSEFIFPEVSFSIVGFCGKFYAFYKITVPKHSKEYYSYHREHEYAEDVNIYFYGKDTNLLTEFFIDKICKKTYHLFIKRLKKKPKKLNILNDNLITFKRKTEYYLVNITPKLEPLFLKYETPCFLITKDKYKNHYVLKTNPTLKDIQFFKVFVPTLAYQEIEMFFNSVLVQNEEPLQITDSIVLLEAKGFDKKKSFRHRK